MIVEKDDRNYYEGDGDGIQKKGEARRKSKEIEEIFKNNEIKHILIEMFTSYKECNRTPEEIETRVSWNCSDLSETKRSEICTKAKVWRVLIEKLETEKEGNMKSEDLKERLCSNYQGLSKRTLGNIYDEFESGKIMILIEMLKKWREGTMNIEEMEAGLYENYPNLSNEELSNLYNEFIGMIGKSGDDMNGNNIDPNITRVENKIDREKCKKVIEEYIRRKNPIKEDDPQKKVEPIEGDSKHTNTISEDAQQKEEQKIEWEIMKEIFSCFQKGIFKSPIIRKKVLYENEETPKSWETKYFSTYRKLMRFIESLERKEKPNLDHVLSVFKNHLSEILKNYKDTIKTMHPKVEYKWLEDLKGVDGLVKKMRPYVEDILPKDEEKKDNKSKKKAKREKTKTKENNIQENGEKKENTYDYVKNMYIPKEIQKIIYNNYKEIIFDEKGKNNFVENCRKEGLIPTIRRKIKKDLRRTILKEGRNIEYYENIDYENVYYSPDVLRYKKWLCIHAKKIVEMIETRLQKDKLTIQKEKDRLLTMDNQIRKDYSKCFKPQPKNPKAPNDQ